MMNKRELLIQHEGYREKPYKCTAGKLTIGVGRNIEDNGLRADEIMLMMDNDIAECEAVLSDRIFIWGELNEVRQAVLVNMMFNLGWPRLSGFKKTIEAVERKDFTSASQEMLDSRWALQVGERANELSRLMAAGSWDAL
jgi:lysozyme